MDSTKDAENGITVAGSERWEKPRQIIENTSALPTTQLLVIQPGHNFQHLVYRPCLHSKITADIHFEQNRQQRMAFENLQMLWLFLGLVF